MKFKHFLKKGTNFFYALTLIFGLLISNEIQAQNNSTISGQITDSSGLALTGVNVIEKGTKNSASTDFDGKFSFKVSNPNATLIISFIGFTQQEVNLAGRSSLNIKLHDEQETLKEVVVVGYGTAKKTDVTGSISTISAATITERNATNPLESIQGSTPGVQITSSTGRAGDGYNVVIRGKNSLISDTTPLYVVDGVPTDNIDFLNPQDIARMDVLKDASSAAIYGSRGASGVIIIASKPSIAACSALIGSISVTTTRAPYARKLCAEPLPTSP